MKRFALVFLLLAGVCQPLFAQGVRVCTVVQDRFGRAIASPTVRACAEPATGTTCTPLVSGGLFSDRALTQPLPNPMTGDTNGNACFYVAPQRLHLQVSGNGIVSYDLVDMVAYDPSLSYAGTFISVVAPSTAPANQFFTGLNSSGVFLTAQPSAAMLSDGVSGTGAVVLATGATLTSPALLTPTITSPTFITTALFPDGSTAAPGIAFSGETGSGLQRTAAGQISLNILGAHKVLWDTTQRMASNFPLTWSSNTEPFGNPPDTGLSRDAAGVIDVGNGTAGNKSGTIKLANVTIGKSDGTLPAQFTNDSLGGFLWTTNGGKQFEINNSGQLLLFGSSSGSTILQASSTASGTLTLPAASGTLARTSGDTFTSTTLTGPIINGTPTGTGIQTVTIKKGSGTGNYTGTNTTYSNLDGTFLSYTVTIPTGWKLAISSSGTIFVSTAAVNVFVSLADGGATLIEAGVTPSITGAPQFFGFNWVINGDGASHTITLQAKTANAADAWNIGNANSTSVPQMIFFLTPSS